MKPLIEITTVPIQVEMKTTNAKLEYVRGTAEMEVSREQQGKVSIKGRPIKVSMDTFESRGEVTPTLARSQKLSVSNGNGQTSTYTATASYNQGQLLLKAQMGTNFSLQMTGGVAMDREMSAIMTDNAMENNGAGYMTMPIEGVSEFALSEGEMNIRYEMDKLCIDWKMNQGEFEFTPGDIEFIVTQRPEVIVKYIGEPLYVPPSADPNYEPVDVTV
ncbi:MAG: hypothetical protein HFE73_00730 [Firmicutes bacterium]|nr:hypothetical protein [Bacillota bacterium]